MTTVNIADLQMLSGPQEAPSMGPKTDLYTLYCSDVINPWTTVCES